MKIALLIHELLREGGTERQCLALARALTELGHQVTIYTCAYSRERCYQDSSQGLDVRVAGRGWFPGLTKPKFLRRYLDMRELGSTIQESYDVWNPHHWPPHWAALEARRRFGGAVVWMCNDIPDMHEKAHETGGPHRYALRRYWNRFVYNYDRNKVKNLDGVVVLANVAKQSFSAIYPGRVEVVRSGVDWQQFASRSRGEEIRSRFGVGKNVFLVLFLGILMPHRRLEDAIAAIAQLRSRNLNVRLLIAGSPANRPEYLTLLQSLGREKKLGSAVIFAGRVPEGELKQYYDACDVFVLPNENYLWGLVVMEAMACGKPVIVSTGAGVHEVLQDGNTALLVPPRSPEAIADRIELLMHDPALRQRLAENGQSFVRDHFSWTRYARDMLAVFEQAISRRL